MISKLTQEQIDSIPSFVEKWINIGLSTTKTNRVKAEKIIDKIYKNGGFKPVKKVWVDSPFEFKQALKEHGDPEDKFDSNNICFGSNEASWLSFYDFFYTYFKKELEIINDIKPLMDLSKECFWYYPLDGLCIISEKPKKIHLNENEDLHCEYGPAIEFINEDIEKSNLYFLNGVSVPKHIVMTPANEMDCSLFLKEKNVEIRREIVRKIGIERIIKKIGAKIIDKKDNYELLSVEYMPNKFNPYLKMINPSIGTYHVEGVHPDCKTVDDALEWRNGTSKSPSILT